MTQFLTFILRRTNDTEKVKIKLKHRFPFSFLPFIEERAEVLRNCECEVNPGRTTSWGRGVVEVVFSFTREA